MEIERPSQGARQQLDKQGLGSAARNYISEVLRFRVEDTVEVVRGALQ